jgi:hypothetical protein
MHQNRNAVSFFEVAAQIACERLQNLEESLPAGAGGELRMIRAIKPLKIARLMKLGKSRAVVTRLMDSYEISPKQGKTVQLMGTLIFTVHVSGSVFWFWKVLASGEDKMVIDEFLDGLPWRYAHAHTHTHTQTHKLTFARAREHAHIHTLFSLPPPLLSLERRVTHASTWVVRIGMGAQTSRLRWARSRPTS